MYFFILTLKVNVNTEGKTESNNSEENKYIFEMFVLN